MDLITHETTVIVGTLFKEQKKKPNVFAEISSVIKQDRQVERGAYCDEVDIAILEDASGRITISFSKGSEFDCQKLITGSILALLGKADAQGYFHVQDICKAGIPFPSQWPENVNTSLQRDLFDQNLLSSNRKFVAFVSGLHFGKNQTTAQKNAYTLAAKFFAAQNPSEKLNQLTA